LNANVNITALQSKLQLYIKQYLINLTCVNNITKCIILKSKLTNVCMYPEDWEGKRMDKTCSLLC